MGFYDDQVLPRIVDLVLGRPVAQARARVTAGLSGEILEIGFGSGRNIAHLPATVTRLLAVEPAAVGRTLAAPRIAAAPVTVEFVGDDGQALHLPDASAGTQRRPRGHRRVPERRVRPTRGTAAPCGRVRCGRGPTLPRTR
ncbi:hypothetical protein FF36_05132 [Frankia torreyi]|uniref:Uncharacterized protein n=1 Tax=Frankia torreyi TaxID=1856 RepID=A0A0D8B8V1_9ACTN|nr:hypothetical protein FF36_05132 [Frankia torreyi]